MERARDGERDGEGERERERKREREGGGRVIVLAKLRGTVDVHQQILIFLHKSTIRELLIPGL